MKPSAIESPEANAILKVCKDQTMSSPYNHINGQQRPTVGNNSIIINGVGSHISNNRKDNDYTNHREISTSNHTELSSSSAQLTSKTALLVRQRRAMLEQLSCYLCQGYLIDATTIEECMDSFCKSCIVRHLSNHSNCPKCGTIIQKPTDAAIRSDKILQDIVYKLIPGLYDDEMKRRRDFYRGYLNGAGNISSDDDEDTLIINGNGASTSGEKYGLMKKPKPFYKPTDAIDLSIEPQTRGGDAKIYFDNKRQSIVTCFTGRLQQRDLNTGPIFTPIDSQLFKTYLRCPGKLSVAQLKKFITAKFNMCRNDTIHLFYLNESLKDEYSLIDVAYIYDWRGVEHMQLFFVIERDLSTTSVSDDSGPGFDGSSRATNRRTTSVGTQASKRVCIDPEPRYCEERTIHNGTVTTNGRAMRSRDVAIGTSSPSKVVVKTLIANPIIKVTSSITNNDKTTSIDPTNGIQTRSVQTNNRIRATSPGSVEPSRSLRSQQPVAKAVAIPGKADIITNNNNINDPIGITSGNIPHQSKKFIPVSKNSIIRMTGASNAPSSLVTLASFTGARTNSMAAMAATTSSATTSAPASTMTYTDKSPIGNAPHSFQKSGPVATTTTSTRSFVASTNPSKDGKTGGPAARLAFSFVTERGITIVQRMNNGEPSCNGGNNSKGNHVQSSQSPNINW